MARTQVLPKDIGEFLDDTAKKALAGIRKPNPFKDAWDFLGRAVWTKDEATGTVRQFPADMIWAETGELQYGYLKYLTQERLKYRIFAIDKARRMLITWWMLGLYLYDILTQPNHANFVVSKKLENSAYLLGEERMLFMYQHIPERIWPERPPLNYTGRNGMGYELVSCPSTGSYVQAVAQGADQLRQYTASNVLFDEFAFQERQQAAWAAAKPTIDGGGHADIVSTPELGAYMYDLLYGTGGGDSAEAVRSDEGKVPKPGYGLR